MIKKIPYLIIGKDYGDVRIKLEFMLPKGSNAGVYVMGRFEVQIFDSFGRPRVDSGDLGEIYQRWDPARSKGQQGFEGVAPIANAAKARAPSPFRATTANRNPSLPSHVACRSRPATHDRARCL